MSRFKSLVNAFGCLCVAGALSYGSPAWCSPSSFSWHGTLTSPEGETLKDMEGAGQDGHAHIQMTSKKSCELTIEDVSSEQEIGVLKCHRDDINILPLTFRSEPVNKYDSIFVFDTPKGKVRIEVSER